MATRSFKWLLLRPYFSSLGLTKKHRYSTGMDVVFEVQEKHTLVSHDRLCFVLNLWCFSLFVLLVLHQSKVVNSILVIVWGFFWRNTTKSHEDWCKDGSLRFRKLCSGSRGLVLQTVRWRLCWHFIYLFSGTLETFIVILWSGLRKKSPT